MSDNSIRVLVLGDSGVGKTTFINRLTKEEFEKKFLPTGQPSERDHGPFTFIDVSGQDRFTGLRDHLYGNIDAAIVMFDVTSPSTFRNVKWWIDDLRRVFKGKVVVAGNKSESSYRKIYEDVVDISVKNNENLTLLLQYLF